MAHVKLGGNQKVLTPEISGLRKNDLQLKEFSNEVSIHFVEYLDRLCDIKNCTAVISEGGLTQPYAFDYGHTTMLGSRILAKITTQAVEERI